MTDSTMPDYQCYAPQCRTTRYRLASDPSDSYARAAGWHIWRQVNHAEESVVERALCPEHAGNAKRTAKPEHLDGELPLW